MSAAASTPWGKMPLAHGRTGASRLACAGAGETSPGRPDLPRLAAARPAADDSSRGGDALTAAPAADSHISAGAAFCSAPRAEGAEPRPVAELSEPALMVLQLIAAHHGCGLGRAVELAAFAYADEIGLPALLDARADFAHGRTGASRLACPFACAPSPDDASDDGRAPVGASGLRPDGDITDVPPFERSGGNRFSHTCERALGRQEAPLGLLPMPHAPP